MCVERCERRHAAPRPLYTVRRTMSSSVATGGHGDKHGCGPCRSAMLTPEAPMLRRSRYSSGRHHVLYALRVLAHTPLTTLFGSVQGFHPVRQCA
jgi:hypothetical protein